LNLNFYDNFKGALSRNEILDLMRDYKFEITEEELG
jgi:hypothetical protein